MEENEIEEKQEEKDRATEQKQRKEKKQLLKELLQPILIVSMILISAPLILKNNERKFPLTIMCLTILIGFVIYFLVDFMYVLGSMEKLNPFIAGTGPVGICLLIGCYLVSAFDEIKMSN